MRSQRIRACCAPLCIASTLTLAKIARASDFAWIGSVDSQWSNHNNWNPIGVPSNGDNANIYGYSPSGNISINVNYDSTVTPASLSTITVSADGDSSLTTNAATLNISSGTLNAATENIGTFIGAVTQVEYGHGVVNQSGGTNTVGSLAIGDDQIYPAGTYNLSGSGVLNVTSYERVGYFALSNNTFNQTGGTHNFNLMDLQGAYNLNSGTLIGSDLVDRAGSFTQSGGNATIQTLGIGGIFIGPFGAMIPLQGADAVSAGSLNVTTLSVGDGSADGTLSITGTGQVTTPQLNNSTTGTIQLSGGTLAFTTLANNGAFSWTGGALEVQTSTTFDGSNSNTTPGGLFNAALSLTSNRTLKIDGTETLGGTSGFALTIPTGGSNIVHQLNISPNGGSLSLTGGTLTCNAIDLVGQPQHFKWTAGTLNLLNAVTFDPNASTLTTGSIFGTTLSLSNRSLLAPAETLTSTVRGETFALSVAANGNNLISGALTVDTLGSLTINGGTVAAASTSILTGGKLLYSSGTFAPGAFSVQGTGVATLSATNSAVAMNSLSVDNTAKLDIGSTKLIIHSADQTALRAMLQNGYDSGAWDKGLHSGQAAANLGMGIGYLLNTASGVTPIYSTFGGQSVSATDTLVELIYLGDANLDGTVNALDFNALATSYGQTPGSDLWSQGDFNYDGTVNSQDFSLLAANYGKVIASSADVPDTALPPGALVPEPTSLVPLGFVAGFLTPRRRPR